MACCQSPLYFRRLELGSSASFCCGLSNVPFIKQQCVCFLMCREANNQFFGRGKVGPCLRGSAGWPGKMPCSATEVEIIKYPNMFNINLPLHAKFHYGYTTHNFALERSDMHNYGSFPSGVPGPVGVKAPFSDRGRNYEISEHAQYRPPSAYKVSFWLHNA